MRLVDADALELFIKTARSALFLDKTLKDVQTRDEMFLNFQQYVHLQPTADNAVRGKWIEAKINGMSLYPDGQKMCSVCNQIMPSAWEKMPPHCYGCGAKMDAEE